MKNWNYALAYLSTPYSLFPAGIEAAFCAAARLAGHLTSAGIKLYSPIVHCHVVARAGGIDPRDAAFWLDNQQVMMERSDVLIVGKLVSWRESFGIAVEVQHFRDAGKPIFYCDPATLSMARAGADGRDPWDMVSPNEIRRSIGLPPIPGYDVATIIVPALAHGKTRSEQGGSSA